MEFPRFVSLTVTNACNLRCQMCGQWSEEGYIHSGTRSSSPQMTLPDWKRLVDEVAEHDVHSILVRGGEPFLLSGIMDLLKHISATGNSLSIDTNGTTVDRFADELVRLGGPVHITFSVDGPEPVHDEVRQVRGSFQKTKAGIARLMEAEAAAGVEISKSICFTISPYSYRGLGQMAEVARSLGLKSINIVPYYYFPNEVGQRYAQELTALGVEAFSWSGFNHEDSGIDYDEFIRQLRTFLADLGEIENFPFMPMDEEKYRIWFGDATTPALKDECNNVEKLIDIQPDGEANFCVDFPDYSIGNVSEATIAEVWNSDRAEQFREYRRKQPLSVCRRCGAKYISELEG